MGISQKTKEAVADALVAAIIKHASRNILWTTGKTATHMKLSVEKISLDDSRLCMDVDWTSDPRGEGWIPIDD